MICYDLKKLLFNTNTNVEIHLARLIGDVGIEGNSGSDGKGE